MSKPMITLEGVVQDFVSSLSDAEKETVKSLVLNPQVKCSLDWYKHVVRKYLQGLTAATLIDSIAEKYADEAVWRDLESSQGLPLFEAGIILRESQIALTSYRRL